MSPELQQALHALQAARTFIRNGVDPGYIRMPDADTPDPAYDTQMGDHIIVVRRPSEE